MTWPGDPGRGHRHTGMRVELRRGPSRELPPLGVEAADEQLDFARLLRKLSARPWRGDVTDLPTVRHQPVECAPASERRLDRIVRHVVRRKDCAELTLLPLPRDGAVGTRARDRCRAIRMSFETNVKGASTHPGPLAVFVAAARRAMSSSSERRNSVYRSRASRPTS